MSKFEYLEVALITGATILAAELLKRVYFKYVAWLQEHEKTLKAANVVKIEEPSINEAKTIEFMQNKNNECRAIDIATTYIKSFEGFRSQAYICPAGKLTIGYGQCIEKGEYPNGITETEAEILLKKYLQKTILDIKNTTPSIMNNPNKIAALLSFIYNVGAGAFRKSTLVKKINANAPIEEIKAEFMRWNHIDKVVSKGLTKRREKEAELYGRI
jgi:lysozyme